MKTFSWAANYNVAGDGAILPEDCSVMLGLETRSRLETVSRPVSEVLVLVLVLNSN